MRHSRFQDKLFLIPQVSAVIVFLISLMAFSTWILLPSLKWYSTGSMKFNTSIGMMLSASILWFHAQKKEPPLLSWLVFLIGSLTLAEYILGMNFGIDHLVISDFPSTESLLFPGRMSPIAALGFCLFSIACLAIKKEDTAFQDLAYGLLILLMVLSLFNLLGYLYGEEAFYKIGPYIRISWQSSICFFLLTIGELFVRPQQGPIVFLTNPGFGGIIARRLLPVMVLTPITLGLIWLFVRRNNLLSRELAVSFFVIAVVLIMVSTLGFTAHQLNNMEERNKRSSEEGQKIIQKSDFQLRFALEAGEMGTWSVDLVSGKVTLSEESERIFGLKEKTIDINRSIDAVIHPDDREKARKDFMDAIALRRLYRSEYRIIRPIDGEERWIFATGKGVIENGKMTLITGVIMDITDEFFARAALAESEAKFRTITNAMPQIVWSTLPDGYHDYYNRRWYEFTGVPDGSTDGEGWNNIFHPDDQQRAWKAWEHSLKSGDPYEIEYRLRHHSGSYRWVLGRALPVLGNDGTIIRWMGTCTDIQDQKEVEQRLTEAVRGRDDFLSIASHELKTPLTSLLLQAHIMRRARAKNEEKPLSLERVGDFINLTEKQVMRLNRLVDDMLDVSRIRSGKLTLIRFEMDLDELIAEVIQRMRPEFEGAGYVLPEVPKCSDTKGNWDRMRLEQVILNLLTNAIRYGDKNKIEVLCDSTATTVRLIVRDQGIGIAPETQAKIFDRFERGIDSSEVSGLGLGLFITKQIVVSHGGKIWVESELGKGSSFFVELPRA